MSPFSSMDGSVPLPAMSADMKRIYQCAIDVACQFSDECLNTSHLLAGIAIAQPNKALDILNACGISADVIRAGVSFLPGPFTVSGPLHLTPWASRVLEESLSEAKKRGGTEIDANHLLIALVRVADGSASEVLQKIATAMNGDSKGSE